MAPLKVLQKTTMLPIGRKTIKSKTNTNQDQNSDPDKKGGKRKADASPIQKHRTKRSALGNLTNAVINQNVDQNSKKNILAKKREVVVVPTVKKPLATVNTNPVLKIPRLQEYGFAAPRPTKVLTRAAARANEQASKKDENETAVKPKDTIKIPQKPVTRRISNEFEKTEESLYMSALEEFSSSESIKRSPNSNAKSRRSIEIDTKESSDSTAISERITGATELKSKPTNQPSSPPEGVANFDKDNWDDTFQVSHYVMDIFNYLKERETHFKIDNYMERQVHLSVWMRTLLVDWMVEVQETFELNHETLYLAVKIVDIYLSKIIVIKENLQLLGAAALFIACKFDERTPPLIDDFLYICDNAYNKRQLVKMEIDMFTTIDYDLGIPLSYRFLRRYARCSKATMPILTLARYILELSLMDYSTISFSDSQMACAALFIARRMNNKSGWDRTLEYYSGYTIKDFSNIVPILNADLHQKPRDLIKTIRSKYSHKIFFEVAKTPLMKTDQLFDETSTDCVEDIAK